MNTGSEGWTPAQRDSMVIGGAALSAHYGYPSNANRAHKETSSTGTWDTTDWRRAIRAARSSSTNR